MRCLFVGGPLDHKMIDVEKPIPDTYRHIPDGKHVDDPEVTRYNIHRLGSKRIVYYLYAIESMTLEGMIGVLMDWYEDKGEKS